MSYIKPEWRKLLDPGLGELLEVLDQTNPDCRVGFLNYIISTLVRNYTGSSYRTKNEMIGVLECAKLELYRVHVEPYEEGKLVEHGDVPTLEELRGRS